MQEAPIWASQRGHLGARETVGTASSPPTWLGTALPALPDFLPSRGLSPALLSAGDWTACLCHPCPSQPPYSCPCFFLPISHLSLQLPESAASPARHQPAWASFRQCHCHCSGALFCRAGCLHPQLPPHTLQEDAQSCVEPAEDNSVAPPPLTTAAAHSPPEKAKPKACTPWGSPFFSTVEYRGKPGLSRPHQLEKLLCTV